MGFAPCFVYVIGAESGHSKIGIATDAAKRLRDLQLCCPIKLTLFNSNRALSRAEASRIERGSHDALKPQRIHGEWFSIEPEYAWATVKDVAKSINDMAAENPWRREVAASDAGIEIWGDA